MHTSFLYLLGLLSFNKPETTAADTIYYQNCRVAVRVFNPTVQDESEINAVFSVAVWQKGQFNEVYKDSVFSASGKLELKDFNQDQVKDILVYHTSDVRSNQHFYLYMMDTTQGSLIKVKGFEHIKNPEYLLEYKLITNYVVSGQNYQRFYRIQGDSVVDLDITLYGDPAKSNKAAYERAYNNAIRSILQNDDRFVSYTVDVRKQALALYWKDDKGNVLGSIQRLKDHLEQLNKKLLFATNGGMYQQDQSPVGLFIENGKQLYPLNKASGEGNFYMKPNGVFYITADGLPHIVPTDSFQKSDRITYATQSGPILVVNGKVNAAFKKGSANLNVRNGVGILPDNRIVFAMSKEPINFYDFAHYFAGLGCKNALYLDGFVSRTYLPEKNWEQTSGAFGVMIAVTQDIK